MRARAIVIAAAACVLGALALFAFARTGDGEHAAGGIEFIDLRTAEMKRRDAERAAFRSGEIRVRLVDAERRRLTGLSGEFTLVGEVHEPSEHDTLLDHSAATTRWERRVVAIDVSGEQTFEALPTAIWWVECTARDRRRAHDQVYVGPQYSSAELEFVLTPRRTVHVALRERSGAPFVARLEQRLPGYAELLRPSLASDSTEFVGFDGERLASEDAAYWYTLHADSAGPVELSVKLGPRLVAHAHVPAHVDHVTLDASIDDLCRSFCTLAVVVRDDVTGCSVAGANVRVNGACPRVAERRTDSDGRARFDVLASEIELQVTAEGFAPSERKLELAVASVTTETVRIERGVTISGRLVDANGAPANAAARIFLFANGASVGLARSASDAEPARASFVFPRLPRGEYVVCADANWPVDGVAVDPRLELAEPPSVLASKHALPPCALYVDARRGDVLDLVIPVPQWQELARRAK